MQSPISTPGRSGPGQSSNVRIPNPGEPITRNFRAITQLASAVAGQASGLQTLKDQIAAGAQAVRPLAELHPFKIYQLPGFLRPDGENPASDWLQFRVRAGRVLESDALGTDGEFNPLANADPDSEYLPLDESDISVPIACPQFWFWLEIGQNDSGHTEAIVRYGPEPDASSYNDEWETENPWTGFPMPDAAHVPIGWVDTLTHASAYTPIIRQLLRTDLAGGTGGATKPVWQT
jgi:hypothetical protein